MNFILIMIDKDNVESMFEFETVNQALSYGRILSRNNPNAIVLELVSKSTNGALLKKWR